MQIKLGKIKKKINSTKYLYTLVKTVDAKLKEPTDVKSPVFLLQRMTNNVDKCNYVHCDWGYYWVDDVVYVTNDIVELHCHRDVLATGYNAIIRQKAFVLYASEVKPETKAHLLDDPRLQPDRLHSQTDNVFRGSHFATTGDDCAIIFTFCGIGFGAASLVMNYSTYKYVIETLMGANGDVSNLDAAVGRFLGVSWKDCVISAILTPFSKTWLDSVYTDSINEIVVGTKKIFLTSRGVHLVDSIGLPQTIDSYITIPMPLAYMSNTYKFLYGKKYTNVQVHTSGGSFDISSDDFIHDNRIIIEEKIFPASGAHTIEIYVDEGVGGSHLRGSCLACIKENLGLDMISLLHGYSVNDTNQAYIEGAARILYATDAAIQGLDETKIFKAFAGPKIEMAAKSMGGANGFGDYDLYSYRVVTQTCVPEQLLMITTTTENDLIQDWSEKNGLPVNKVITLGSRKGYIQCSNASFDPSLAVTYSFHPLYPSEIAEINGYLNTGFYLEDHEPL